MINEKCNFFDNALDNLLDAYNMQDWNMTLGQFLTQASSEFSEKIKKTIQEVKTDEEDTAELEETLKKLGLSLMTSDEEERYIPMCDVAEIHSGYENWTGNSEEDYGDYNEEIMDALAPWLESGKLRILDCDACCGCGDW